MVAAAPASGMQGGGLQRPAACAAMGLQGQSQHYSRMQQHGPQRLPKQVLQEVVQWMERWATPQTWRCLAVKLHVSQTILRVTVFPLIPSSGKLRFMSFCIRYLDAGRINRTERAPMMSFETSEAAYSTVHDPKFEASLQLPATHFGGLPVTKVSRC